MPTRKFDKRSLIAFLHDLLAIAVAWWLAYLFRFNFEIPPLYSALLIESLPWFIVIQAGFFLLVGLYRGLWRYASIPDLKRILLVILLGTTISLSLLHLSGWFPGIPRSVFLLAPILLLLIMCSNRLMYRAWKERRLYSRGNPEGRLVLILGAGSSAISLVEDLARSRDWHVVGLLDDDPLKLGRRLHGVRVLGIIDDLAHWVKKLDVGYVIIAMPSVSHHIHRRALEICSDIGVKVKTVPSYIDLISGNASVSQIRDIELDDLLGRAPVVLNDKGLHDLITKKTIMITGAGGSIGSELCRQIIAFQPGRLILLELGELALYNIEEEFRAKFPHINFSFVIGDIKDRARVEQLFTQFNPTVVFHAAAYKHVPLMENDNTWQAMLNNVKGTYVLAQTAIKFGVEKFVLISTDKAVNPINVMGASKRLAEMVCQAAQQSVTHLRNDQQAAEVNPTCFVIVRFGNVLGSTGSVIPKFREQIAKGGPITITHPEISRYFMSIPEAAQLVLQAGSMGGMKGGGEIFVLDMGNPVKIVDLVNDLIRLSGLNKDDIEIVYCGLRPGEKLHEELSSDNEESHPTIHSKLRLTVTRQVDEQWLVTLTSWFDQHPVLGDDEVKQALKKWVPEYSDK